MAEIGHETTGPDQEVRELRALLGPAIAEVEDLRALLSDALARIDDLASRHASPVIPVPVPVRVPEAATAERMGRRRALKGAMVAAVGAAAAGLVLGEGTPAAAVDGDNIRIGFQHNATSSTTLSFTGTSTNLGLGFAVFDQTPGTPTTAAKGAIIGHAKGTNFNAGVYGHGEGNSQGVYGVGGSNSVGVFGVNGGSVAGVSGESQSGPGVAGRSKTSGPGVNGVSDSGSGIAGLSTSGLGVKGTSTSWHAVEGTSTNGVGVHGISPNNTGVWGESTASYGVSGVSANNIGVFGESSKTIGLYGSSTSGQTSAIGVQGITTLGSGVKGTVTTGTGVYGESTSTSSGYGMQAISSGGNGLKAVGKVYGVIAQSFSTDPTQAALAASSLQAMAISATTDDGLVMSGASETNGGIEVKAPKWHFRMANAATRNAPTTDAFAHQAGEIVYSSAGETWVCVKGGTPGTWRKVAGQATAGSFHVLAAPARAYDSRPGTNPSQGPKTKLSGNVARVIDCSIGTGVPKGATAINVTLLLVNAANASGNLTMWANGVAKPASNTIVWGGSAARFTTSTITALDPNAKLQIAASASTDVVIDIVGYYR